jgi:hypothetical protein
MTTLLIALLLSQAPPPCLAQYQKLFPEEPLHLEDCSSGQCSVSEVAACNALASQLSAEAGLSQRLAEAAVSHEMVEPVAGTAGATGTPAHVDAAASVKTVGLFGTSLGFSTAPSEEGALLTIAVNPLAIASATSREFSWHARLTDLRIVLPAAVTQGQRPDFIGLHVNLDFLGASRAAREYERLLQASSEAHQRVLSSGGELNAAVGSALNSSLADQPEQRAACVEALFQERASLEAIDAACGTALSAQLGGKVLADSGLRRSHRRFRHAVEQSHGGLNVQLALPTSGSSSRPLHAVVLGSHELQLAGQDSGWQAGLVASAAADYLRRDGSGALGGALAVALTADARVMQLGALHLSAGLQGHLGQKLSVGGTELTGLTGTFLHGELGVRVPLGSTGAALAGSVTWPMLGDGAGRPFFSTSIDYAFLKGSGS